mmetsp:Transcript_112560/g.317916  ORF Transcript_112560/g.317916 Transcript_112560/m.317916 type:complete len:233 (-) Transcript_112560:921-1619(-)
MPRHIQISRRRQSAQHLHAWQRYHEAAWRTPRILARHSIAPVREVPELPMPDGQHDVAAAASDNARVSRRLADRAVGGVGRNSRHRARISGNAAVMRALHDDGGSRRRFVEGQYEVGEKTDESRYASIVANERRVSEHCMRRFAANGAGRAFGAGVSGGAPIGSPAPKHFTTADRHDEQSNSCSAAMPGHLKMLSSLPVHRSSPARAASWLQKLCPWNLPHWAGKSTGSVPW